VWIIQCRGIAKWWHGHKISVTDQLKRVLIECWAQLILNIFTPSTDQLPRRTDDGYECNKEFELMLTRRAKVYSSFCLQTVSLSSAISSRLLRGYSSLMLSRADFFEPRKSRLGPLKFTFNAENFICSLSMSISIGFGATHPWKMCLATRNRQKNP